MACLSCGGHGPGRLWSGRWSCDQCGAPRYAQARPLLIVSGAASAGKSSVCAMLAAEADGVLAFDVDVLAGGAAAVTGQSDYHAFWAYLSKITLEIHQNKTDVVWCGVCRPDQIAEQPLDLVGAFSAIEMLVLSCDAATYLDRLYRRPGGGQAVRRAAFHATLNDDLRASRSIGPLAVSHLDTTELTVQQTQRRSLAWVQERGGIVPAWCF